MRRSCVRRCVPNARQRTFEIVPPSPSELCFSSTFSCTIIAARPPISPLCGTARKRADRQSGGGGGERLRTDAAARAAGPRARPGSAPRATCRTSGSTDGPGLSCGRSARAKSPRAQRRRERHLQCTVSHARATLDRSTHHDHDGRASRGWNREAPGSRARGPGCGQSAARGSGRQRLSGPSAATAQPAAARTAAPAAGGARADPRAGRGGSCFVAAGRW